MAKKINEHEIGRLRKELRILADPKKAKILQQFFKTGHGQYGEGDVFLGVSVPKLRIVAKDYKHLSFKEILILLSSGIHKQRFISLLLLIQQYQFGSGKQREEIVRFYLDNSKYVNNWDLVDLSAPSILGSFLKERKDRMPLYKLATSQNLWERRMAIIATLSFIRNNDFLVTLHISQILLHDNHDLIQKAVGWMLRELGKRDPELHETFIKKHYRNMPRTMLRYAIEQLTERKRLLYLGRQTHTEKEKNKI